MEEDTDSEQLSGLGYSLLYAQKHLMDGRRTLRQIANALEQLLETQGLSALCESRSGIPFLARPRRQEMLACFNRYRDLNL